MLAPTHSGPIERKHASSSQDPYGYSSIGLCGTQISAPATSSKGRSEAHNLLALHGELQIEGAVQPEQPNETMNIHFFPEITETLKRPHKP